MKRKMLSALLIASTFLSMTACGSNQGNGADAKKDSGSENASSELTDGKFADTRHITVEVYDRGNDGGSDPTNNAWTDYIKKGMLEKHNVEVEFVKVPRWTEVEEINNLLASGTAPDICVTYDYATIQTYADMGGVIDLSSQVMDKENLPNLWNWLGETNITYDQDPETQKIWAVEAKLANLNRINTFIRKDWLDKLNLKEPTTKEEFYEVICAFRDNADKLLGKNADKMVPYSVSFDVGWRAATLIESCLDPKMTDKESYINGFDDRKLTQNGTKDAIKLLNKWYNEDLLWKDFALYAAGDSTEDDMMKAGYVGAFSHNWDYPYRNGEDSIEANLERNVGKEAEYIAIDPFEDKDGTHTKWVSAPIDRKVFFPSTNKEVLASLLYLDFISDPETIEYLQIGDEGVTHKTLDNGAVQIQATTDNTIQNSSLNIDYTITCNGLNLKDKDKTALSLAYSYSGIKPELVERADKVAKTDNRPGVSVKVGAISAESGMGEALSSKRDQIYDTSVSAAADKFDSTWESGVKDYLGAGGQAIMDERTSAWKKVYGDSDSVSK